jgi:hypothetical protein
MHTYTLKLLAPREGVPLDAGGRSLSFHANNDGEAIRHVIVTFKRTMADFGDVYLFENNRLVWSPPEKRTSDVSRDAG